MHEMNYTTVFPREKMEDNTNEHNSYKLRFVTISQGTVNYCYSKVYKSVVDPKALRLFDEPTRLANIVAL